ncbi:MAG: hypothetical protein JWP10_463 [Nocardioidaceae bacterium]|nr:hypothetical protein [Nocardioidaceae bacterium]
MRLPRHRRVALSVVACAAALLLSSCGDIRGFNYQTNAVYDASVGTNVRGTPVEVLNGLFVANDDGTATFSGGLLNKSGQVQTIQKVTAVTDEGIDVPITLAGPLSLTESTLYTTGTTADIVLDSGEVKAGDFVEVTFTFDEAADVTANVPVVERVAMYDDVAEGPDVSTQDLTQKATDAATTE